VLASDTVIVTALGAVMEPRVQVSRLVALTLHVPWLAVTVARNVPVIARGVGDLNGSSFAKNSQERATPVNSHAVMRKATGFRRQHACARRNVGNDLRQVQQAS